jgi:hypothetical protein
MKIQSIFLSTETPEQTFRIPASARFLTAHAKSTKSGTPDTILLFFSADKEDPTQRTFTILTDGEHPDLETGLIRKHIHSLTGEYNTLNITDTETTKITKFWSLHIFEIVPKFNAAHTQC